jgi:predicted ATPase
MQDFRGLQAVEWSPNGVCLLAGPNGSGKSSILEALAFLRIASKRGFVEAGRLIGGGETLRRLGADADDPVLLEFSTEDSTWTIRLSYFFGSKVLSVDKEELVERGKSVARRRLLTLARRSVLIDGEEHESDERSVLSMYLDSRKVRFRSGADLLMEQLQSVSVCRGYRLDSVRSPQATSNWPDTQLDPTGANVWVVLRAWKAAARRFQGQFEWVLSALKRAFPDLVVDLEFDELGGMVFGRFYPANAESADASLPLSAAADGFLVGLLHLTAVAGAKGGSILAFDEVENQLHPHAIRSILASMRERAEERDLTIILTTHSPVVMNAFKGHESQFFVLESGHDKLPVPLDEARDPEWLAHFSLGDLYEREEFAAPRAAAAEAP